MSDKSISIGSNVYVSKESIDCYGAPGAAPINRIVAEAQKSNNLIDYTVGKKTRALIFLKSGKIIKSILSPEAIDGRFNKDSDKSD